MWKPSLPTKYPIKRPGEIGRASLEFLVAGVILFIPIVLLTVSLWSIQNASLATDAAARHAARVFTHATTYSAASAHSHAAVVAAMQSFGVDSDYRLDLQCRPSGRCLDPGAFVRVIVTTDVALGSIPLVPATIPLSVPISATADARVSGYRGQR